MQPPAVPIYSCATAGRDGPTTSRRSAGSRSSSGSRPVAFRSTVEAMYADGVRVFVEVGARGNLTGFVEDTLRGRPHFAVAANLPRRSGLTQLNHLVASLYAQGVAAPTRPPLRPPTAPPRRPRPRTIQPPKPARRWPSASPRCGSPTRWSSDSASRPVGRRPSNAAPATTDADATRTARRRRTATPTVASTRRRGPSRPWPIAVATRPPSNRDARLAEPPASDADRRSRCSPTSRRWTRSSKPSGR